MILGELLVLNICPNPGPVLVVGEPLFGAPKIG